jgi:flagellar hook-associated protein 2
MSSISSILPDLTSLTGTSSGSSSSGAASVSSTGSSSGIDVESVVDTLIYTERAPERQMQSQQTDLNDRATALQQLQTQLKTLESSVFALKDFTGTLTDLSATSSNESVMTATASSGATTETHTIVVSQLATASSLYGKSITDSAFAFATNSKMTIQVGSGLKMDVTLDGKTLDQAAAYINGSGLGVTASVVNDATGKRLTLVSNTSGLPGAIQISDDSTGLGWKTAATAQNAQLTVDGVPVESTTNAVSGAIAGVTLTLTGQTVTPVSLMVGPDTSQAKQAVNSFVSAYNAVISGLNEQFAYDPSTKHAGVLSGDSTLLQLQSSLLAEMSHTVSGNTSLTTLRSLGVNMSNDGTLTVDDSVIDGVLKSNYDQFRNFFQSTSSANDGFALNLDSILSAQTSTGGPVATDLAGIQNSSKSIQDQIDAFEVRIAARQQQLTDEYTRVDVMLRQFSATQSQISAQLNSLNTNK